MEKWQRDYITECKPTLIIDTGFTPKLLADLKSVGALSREDVVAINGMRDQDGQISKMYDDAQRKANGYEKLIKGLRAANEHIAANLLVQGYRKHGLPIPTAVQDISNQEEAVAVPGPGPSQQQGEDQVDFRINMKKLKPLTVAITRPRTPMKFKDAIDIINGNHKGYALLINIIEINGQRRDGAEVDTRNLKKLLQFLNYIVIDYEGNITLDDMKRYVEKFKNILERDSTISSCVVFLGSHGVYTKLQTSDDKLINLYEDVINQFGSNKCPWFIEKPKIFIVQACREFNAKYDDVKPTMPIQNAIVCYSTMPGTVAARDPNIGTWYIYCLTKVFMDNAHKMSLLELLQETQREMANEEVKDKTVAGQLSTWTPYMIKDQDMYFNVSP